MFFENFQHFWNRFAANVEFMTFVLILIKVWIGERDNVSFYANGQKDPKNKNNNKNRKQSKKISKIIPNTSQLVERFFQR